MKKFENFKEDLIDKIDNPQDPYNEENWDEEIKDYTQSPGQCYNCGSQNISYGETETYDESVGYKYHCEECDSDGEELYSLHFIVNEADV